MKHTILLFVLLLSLLETSAKHEVRLSHERSYMDPDAFVTWTDFFRRYFFTKTGNFPDNNYNKEHVLLQDLLNLETTRLTDLDETAGVEDSAFFHALRIFYGLDTSVAPYRVKLIFLPDWAKATETPGVYSFNTPYPISGTTKVYLAEDMNTPRDYSEVAHYIENYKRTGNLKLRTIESPVPADAADRDLSFDNSAPYEVTYDANGIVFPFQEIRHFFHDATDIYFYSIAEIEAAHKTMFFKHKVVLSSKPVSMSSSAVCANLGALCPPRCDKVMVRTIPGVGTVMEIAKYFDANAKDDIIFRNWMAGDISVDAKNNSMQTIGDNKQNPIGYFPVLMLLLGLFVGFIGCWFVMRNSR